MIEATALASLAPWSTTPGSGTVAAAARHAAVGAAHAAARAGRRAAAEDRPARAGSVSGSWMISPRAVEVLDLLLVLGALAVVAERALGGADHRAFRRQLALHHRQERRLDLVGCRRAAGQVVVDVDDVVQACRPAGRSAGISRASAVDGALRLRHGAVARLDRGVVEVGRLEDLAPRWSGWPGRGCRPCGRRSRRRPAACSSAAAAWRCARSRCCAPRR